MRRVWLAILLVCGCARAYPVVPEGIGDVKKEPIGSEVAIVNVIVTTPQTLSTDSFYVQEANRCAGILLLPPHSSNAPPLAATDVVSVSGQLLTNGAEIYIQADTITRQEIPGVFIPLGLRNSFLGGGEFGSQPGVMDTACPPKPATGLNNVGLSVRTWGRVTHAEPNFYYVDDGSGLDDGSGYTGVRVSKLNEYLPNDFVIAEGVSGARVQAETECDPAVVREIRSVGVQLPITIDPDDLVGSDMQTMDGFLNPYNNAKGTNRRILPYPSMIAICLDDGRDWPVTSNANFGGITPALYMAQRGFPLTVGIVSASIGGYRRLTAAHIKTLWQTYGWEIASHSATHSASITYDEAVAEVPASKQTIEALESPTGTSLGIVCRAYIRPEPYVANLRTVDEIQNSAYAKAIRRYHECSRGDGYTAVMSQAVGRAQRYFINGIRLDTIDIDDFLAGLSVPGGIHIVYAHNPGDAGEISEADFKQLVDGIITLRDTGKISPVTLTTALTCDLSPLYVSSAGDIMRPMWASVVNGDCETAIWGASPSAYGWTRWSGVGTAEFADEDGEGPGTNHVIELTNAGRISVPATSQAGYSYVVRFKAKRVSGTSTLAFQAYYTPFHQGSLPLQMGVITPIPLTDTLAGQYVTFGLPRNAGTCLLEFAKSGTGVIQMDDVAVERT